MFCPNCGTKLRDFDKFCYVCGARVEDRSEEASFEVSPQQPVAYAQPGYAEAAKSKTINKPGLIGFILSMISLCFLIALGSILDDFIYEYLRYYNYVVEELQDALIELGVLFGLFSLLGAAVSITGICFSGVGISRRKKFRLNGFSIAGLVVSIVMILDFLGTFFTVLGRIVLLGGY